MPSPFPGFDPFIESQLPWADFHTDFLVETKRALLRALPPGFTAQNEAFVSIVFPEQRPAGRGNRTVARRADAAVFATASHRQRGGNGIAVLERPAAFASEPATHAPDAPEIVAARRETRRRLRILDTRDGSETVVALLELLSPTNKEGVGAEEYRLKQSQLLRTDVHVIEIDLLRAGDYVALAPEGEVASYGNWDYLVTLRDRDAPDEYRVWRIMLRDRLPTLSVPLTPDVNPVSLDLQEIFAQCYDASLLARRLDYEREPEPPLFWDDAAWADELLRAAGRRV